MSHPAAQIAAGLMPVAVIGTSGTTTSCAFDPLEQLADVCAKHSLWLHIDAAYGGAYACLEEVCISKTQGMHLHLPTQGMHSHLGEG